MDAIHSIEVTINLLIQSLGAWIEVPAAALSFLGSELFYLLAMPALFWCVDAGLGLRIGVMLTLSNATNAFFKLAFHTPRPYWVDSRVQALDFETSFGLPSGHSQNAASIWGALAASFRRRWLSWVCGALAFLIGLSRLALGLHFTSDVLLGWALGLALLFLVLRFEKPVIEWAKKQPIWGLIAACLFSALFIAGVVCLPVLFLRGWTMPPEWAANIAAGGQELPNPLSLEGAFTAGGLWLGLTAGSAWTFLRRDGFRPRPSILPRLACYLIGMVVLYLLWAGLGALFPDGENLPAYALRFLRYALVSGWVSAGAPWLFTRLGLVK